MGFDETAIEVRHEGFANRFAPCSSNRNVALVPGAHLDFHVPMTPLGRAFRESHHDRGRFRLFAVRRPKQRRILANEETLDGLNGDAKGLASGEINKQMIVLISESREPNKPNEIDD